MRVGTKSLLFGGHQFLIHPIAVSIAWKKIYKKYPSWRESICIFVHDWGYWGKPNMDGPEGRMHPLLGASIAGSINTFLCWENDQTIIIAHHLKWIEFTACHSRYVAEMLDVKPSKLMPADKLGTAILPTWLMWILVGSTGEGKEYLDYWVSLGTYPGKPTIWGLCKAIKADWQRFRVEGQN